MGKVKTSLNIFKYRPTLGSYFDLDHEQKELLEYTVKNNLISTCEIRVRKFFKVKTLKPKQTNLWLLTWNDVILLRKYLEQNDLFSFLKLMYGLNEKAIVKLDAFNSLAAWKWLNEEMKKMNEIEVQELEEDVPDELKNAGIEEMERFNYEPVVDKLAGGDITRYDEFLKLPYAKIFRKLVMEKVIREINQNYKENVSRKAKANSRNNL